MYDDAVMKAFFSEYRSVTFQCNSSVTSSSSIQFSKVNSYIEKDRVMAPQQQDPLPKSSEQIIESEQMENRASPISSLGGTSMDSSSPLLSNEASSENNQNYDMRHSQMHDPSSDDSVSMSNLDYQDNLQSPLQQLQCSLGKDGMLGQKLHLGEYSVVKGNSSNGSCVEIAPADQSYSMYFSRCHICTFVTKSKEEYDMHMSTHFSYRCSYCDYTSKTDGRLKAHMKRYHSKTPPENWSGSRSSHKGITGASQSVNDSVSPNGKNRVIKCKQCDFIADNKNDFWKHNKIHIKTEKQLQCEKCDFVTEYKHHYEYHIRNHFGSKPFKCSKCNYSCVNKSMLNSHSKSHSNVYQYRCADCSYATKYCHSLKLHLRKYEHRPGPVLNHDGTPNPTNIIDTYGTRRGPRAKKGKRHDDFESSPSSPLAASQQPMNYPPAVPFLSPGMPPMFPAHFLNGYPNVYMNAHQPADSAGYPIAVSQVRMQHDGAFKCSFCIFTTDQHDVYQQHIIKHAIENKDIMATMGIPTDSLHFQEPQMFSTPIQRHLEYTTRIQQENPKLQDVTNPNTKYGLEHEDKNIKQENGQNLDNNFKTTPPRNDSRQALSPVGTNTSDTLSQHENHERCSSEERERSVIVTQKILPNSLVQPRVENKTPNPDVKNEQAPLDLSGSKPLDSASDTEKLDGNIGRRSPALKDNSSSDVDTTSTIPRNRRKGRAFKIDQYIQYEDQSETLNNDTEHINQFRNLHNLKETSTCYGQNIQRPLQVLNNKSGSMSPDNIQTVPYKVNSANISNDTKPPNQRRSPPINPKRYYEQLLPITTPRNGLAVTIGDSQQVKSFMNGTESAMLPKFEVNVEQTGTSPKQQEVFKCESCSLTFENSAMYSIHMGYHDRSDPFTCNRCGQETKDKVDFFIHLHRASHV